jgi:hypothetical protein
MRLSSSLRVLVLSPIFLCPMLAAQTAAPTSAQKSPKLCVADVGNGSGKPIFVDQIKEKLLAGLQKADLRIESASTASLVAKNLELSGNNRDSIRLRKCNAMLLTEVDLADSKVAGSGARSDSGTQLVLNFALFKMGRQKAVLDVSLPAATADTPTNAVLAAIDQEVEQVAQAMGKK